MTAEDLRVEALRQAIHLADTIMQTKSSAGKAVSDQTVVEAAKVFYRFLNEGNLQ